MSLILTRAVKTKVTEYRFSLFCEPVFKNGFLLVGTECKSFLDVIFYY